MIRSGCDSYHGKNSREFLPESLAVVIRTIGNYEEEIMPRKKKLNISQRPVENTLRRIAIYRGYWSLAAQILRRQEEEKECREKKDRPAYSA